MRLPTTTLPLTQLDAFLESPPSDESWSRAVARTAEIDGDDPVPVATADAQVLFLALFAKLTLRYGREPDWPFGVVDWPSLLPAEPDSLLAVWDFDDHLVVLATRPLQNGEALVELRRTTQAAISWSRRRSDHLEAEVAPK